jgi:DNA primase
MQSGCAHRLGGKQGVTVEELLQRLEGVRGKGPQWLARCPAHEDKGPSLSIGQHRSGGILLHCFAGCETPDVCAALGIALHDLFPPDDYRNAGIFANPRGNRRWVDVTAVLKALESAIWRLAVAAEDVKQGRPLSEGDDLLRRQAQEQILDAARYARGLR